MNRLLSITATLLLAASSMMAQEHSQHFKGQIDNAEYGVFLIINLEEQDVTVPGQEIYGQLPGYLGCKKNNFCWLITSAEVKGKTAKLSMINDYGSEDLKATLTQENDSVYQLKQTEGSTLKIPSKGKWQKLPKTLLFKTSGRR